MRSKVKMHKEQSIFIEKYVTAQTAIACSISDWQPIVPNNWRSIGLSYLYGGTGFLRASVWRLASVARPLSSSTLKLLVRWHSIGWTAILCECLDWRLGVRGLLGKKTFWGLVHWEGNIICKVHWEWTWFVKYVTILMYMLCEFSLLPSNRFLIKP